MSRRVLLVDDNRELVEDLGEILGDEGYETVVAGTPQEALEKAADFAFDVAVLDVRMPGMDGVSLYGQLADMQPGATYVLMTAFTTDERIANALAAGVRTVLPKPVPMGQLLEILPDPEEGVSRVLVVDDDASLASTIVEALGHQGFDATCVGSITEAKRELETHPPDAVVADVRLPDGNGAELAVELRHSRGLPVVLITGYDPEQPREVTRRAGAGETQVLSKPFAPEALLAALRSDEHGPNPSASQ